MRREGRQHGMVRTYRILPTPLNPRPDTRFVNCFDTPATAGLFTRVPSKPTNHSKFTGKCSQPRCNGCHMHPTCKAKDKTKGNRKLRSNDVVSNYRLLTWRVVDARPGLNFYGVSATTIVDQLSSYHVDDYDHDHEDHDNYEEEIGDYVQDHEDPTVEITDAAADDDQGGRGDDEEETGFCDVGFVLEQVEGDDGWCLVGEM